MFCHRITFKLALYSLLFVVLTTPAFFPTASTIAIAQPEPQEVAQEMAPGHQAIQIEKKPQRVFAPHWTTEKDFSTTIYIRNAHIAQALIAKVSLILNHRTIILADTFVDSLQTVALDVKKALIENGEEPEQSGGALIDFEAESAGAVNAYAQVLDTNRSLGFSFPFMQDGAPASGPLDGVAWFYSKGTDASIALQNTTDAQTTASLTLFVSGRQISLGNRQLKPHEVTAIKLPASEGLGKEDGPRSAGVRVEYSGKPGTVVAQGWVADASIGFSAPFAFHPKSNCSCTDGTQHKYGAGIMIGKGGMTGPIFSPYLAVRNSSDKPLIINPVFSYDTKDKTERVKLSATRLGPQQSTVLNLRKFQENGTIPSWVEMGNIDLQYKGEAGALIAELASVDQNGSFVSPVPLMCKSTPASTMAFWRTDGDWHSSVTIQNIASQDNDLEITVSYPGGIYLLEKKIAAGATAMVSINELQQSQAPDREGRRIPKDATLGGLNIWSPAIINGLVINAMLMNPVTKTCGQCIYPGYVTSYTVSDKQASGLSPLYYGFDPHSVNQSFSIWLNVHYSMGTQGGVTPNSSSSSNPSVATAGGGSGFAVNVGTASITAVGNNFFTDSACSQPGNISSTASVTVIKVDIKQGSTVITGVTQNVIVGQKISLTAEVQPGSVTVTNRKWTIPGVRIANYVASITSGTVTALATNPSGSAVDFYWVDEGDGRQVQITLKVNGVSFTATTTFNVKRPTAQVTATTGTVSIATRSGSLWLQYGDLTNPGITLSRTVTMPSGFLGDLQWVQVANPFRRRRLTSNGTWQTLAGAGLDTFYPYPDTTVSTTSDSPDTELTSDYTEKTANDGFEMWLMFQPIGVGDAIWVPLRKVSWNWSGAATRSGATWSLTSSGNTQNPTDINSTTHPTWTRNVSSNTWQ